MPSDSLVHATSGAAGGCIAMAITYPLISISTRAQVEAKRHVGESSIEAALKLIRREGIRSLYDGLSSSLIGIAVTNGIYYLFFEESRALILRTRQRASANLTTLESMLAGAVAGSMTSIISNPIWVVNTRQTVRPRSDSTNSAPSSPAASSKAGGARSEPPKAQRRSSMQPQQQQRKKMGFVKTILHILRTDGPAAFFHGLGPALVLVINPILQFTLFEQLKNMLLDRRSATIKSNTSSALEPPANVPLTDLDFFLLGAVSKLFATGTTYPYLTVKSRMQSGQAEGKKYKGTIDGLNQIVKREGVKGLYRGIGPKLTQSVLTAAFLFLAKEKIYVATKRALNTAAKATPVPS